MMRMPAIGEAAGASTPNRASSRSEPSKKATVRPGRRAYGAPDQRHAPSLPRHCERGAESGGAGAGDEDIRLF